MVDNSPGGKRYNKNIPRSITNLVKFIINMAETRSNRGMSKFGYWLVAIGAINWGLVGIGGFLGSDWNVIKLIFGSWSWLEWIIYILIGVYGVMMFTGGRKNKVKAAPVSNDTGGGQ